MVTKWTKTNGFIPDNSEGSGALNVSLSSQFDLILNSSTPSSSELLEVIAVLLLKRPTLSVEESDEAAANNKANMGVCKEYLTTLLLVLQRSKDNRRSASYL